MRDFVVFLSPFCEMPRYHHDEATDRFIPNPFQFISHPQFYHWMIYSLTAHSVVK
jgi:hypothetical protein